MFSNPNLPWKCKSTTFVHFLPSASICSIKIDKCEKCLAAANRAPTTTRTRTAFHHHHNPHWNPPLPNTYFHIRLKMPRDSEVARSPLRHTSIDPLGSPGILHVRPLLIPVPGLTMRLTPQNSTVVVWPLRLGLNTSLVQLANSRKKKEEEEEEEGDGRRDNRMIKMRLTFPPCSSG